MAFVSADFMFQPTHQDNHPSPTSPHLLPSYAPQDFHGVSAAQMRRSMSFSGVGSKFEEMNADDDMSDDGSQLGEKKKRLSSEQVKALEKSFDLGNKLEPERKMQLARALGLQPRQVAIWFQNRRARWKTKQLEKDYDLLKRNFEALKSDNDALLAQNKKLQAELMSLKGRESSTGIGPINLNKETEGSWSNGSDNSCDVNLGTTSTISEVPFYSHLMQSSSSRSDLPSHQKIDQMVSDEGFCNMFMGGTIADQSAFWPWPEQQHDLH